MFFTKLTKRLFGDRLLGSFWVFAVKFVKKTKYLLALLLLLHFQVCFALYSCASAGNDVDLDIQNPHLEHAIYSHVFLSLRCCLEQNGKLQVLSESQCVEVMKTVRAIIEEQREKLQEE